MTKETEFEKQLAAEISHIQKKEADKRFLYDKTIGGPNVPRPSDKYIKACVGPLKNDTQIRKEAAENIRRQKEAEEREAQRQEAVARSIQEHNERIGKFKKSMDSARSRDLGRNRF